MKRHPLLVGVFSAPSPGAGKKYAGQVVRGAAILFAILVVGNLKAIWLSICAIEIQFRNSHIFWLSTLPRILHGLIAFYGTAFLFWQNADSY